MTRKEIQQLAAALNSLRDVADTLADIADNKDFNYMFAYSLKGSGVDLCEAAVNAYRLGRALEDFAGLTKKATE